MCKIFQDSFSMENFDLIACFKNSIKAFTTKQLLITFKYAHGKFVLTACFNKKTKALIEHKRCIVIGIEINDKNFFSIFLSLF